MGIFDGILICTDLDGTFLHEAKASEENCRAIRYFQENGGYFTVATGRSPAFVRDFTNYKPNAPLIVSNGTQICDHITGENIKIFPMPDETAEIFDILAAEDKVRDIYIHDTEDGGTQLDITDRRMWNATTGMKPGEWFAPVAKPWIKALLVVRSPEENEALQIHINERWPGMFETDRSYSVGLELHAPGSGKGPCADILRNLLPNIRLVVGAGDYENDISLLKHADIGYAVENALPNVKEAADRITVDVRRHAIAQIIHDLEKEYGR